MRQHLDSALARRLRAVGVCAVLAGGLLAAGIDSVLDEGHADGSLAVRAADELADSWLGMVATPESYSYAVAANEPRGLAHASEGAEADTPQQPALRRLAFFIAERWGVAYPEARSVVTLAWSVGADVMLDPLLLLAVIAVESRFDPMAQSRRGAQGLMQIRTHLHVERFERYGGREAAFDPLANIRVGAELLKDMLVREGSTEGALKAYVGAARRPHDSGYGARVLQTRALLVEAITGPAAVGETAGLHTVSTAALF